MYGDGHVALFNFPPNYDPSWINRPVNVDWLWW